MNCQLVYTNFNSADRWGVLLVDAFNAFNSLTHTAMLFIIHILWSWCSHFLFNTYLGWCVLVLWGSSDFLYSKEGVTEGDLLSMFMYAIGILPLIHSLCNPAQWTQIWYADDASVCGYLKDIHEWFSKLCSWGPDFSYFPELKRTSWCLAINTVFTCEFKSNMEPSLIAAVKIAVAHTEV